MDVLINTNDVSVVTENSSQNYSESIQHLLIKKYFRGNIPLDNEVEEVREEVIVGNRIADVLIELKEGRRVVIEIQHSKITETDIIQRTRDYGKEGCHVLWILNGESHYRYPKIEHVIVELKAEKYLQRMYKGRVYYANASELGMKSGVYPLHFCRVQERVHGYYGMAYFRLSKSKRSVVPGIIPSLKFDLYQHMGFRLAKFTDKNMRRECIDSLKDFLGSYEVLDDEVLLDVLRAYKDRFGLFLLYECLKYLKVVEKRHYRKMFYFNEMLKK